MDTELISEFSKTLIDDWGYPGVFTASFFAADEVIMPFTGFLSGQGLLWLPLVVFLGALSATLASLLAYAIARALGESRLKTLLAGPGKYFLLQAQDIDYGLNVFRHYGSYFVFFSRFFPIVRNVAAIPAGLVSMNLLLFAVLIFCGCMLRNTMLAAGGYLLGSNWHLLVQWFGYFGSLTASAIILLIAYLIFRRLRSKISSTFFP